MSQGLAFLMGALGLGLWKAPASPGEARAVEHVAPGGVSGWMEMRGGAQNVLVWVVGMVVLCLVALVSRPSEASFKTYLTELSFRKHLRDLHRPSGSADARPTTASAGSSGALTPSHPRRQEISDDSGHAVDHPTPFRFSNHVAITLRTPGYTYRSFWLFALVWIAVQPGGHSGGAAAGHKKPALIVGKGGNKHARRIVSGSGSGSPADDEADSWDAATLAGVWYLGALGQWCAMGALPRAPGAIGSKALVAVIVACVWYLARAVLKVVHGLRDRDGKSRGIEETRVGDKTHAGVLNIVTLPDVRDDVASESVTRLIDDTHTHRLTSPLKDAIGSGPARDESSAPQLAPDASLPLHVKSGGHDTSTSSGNGTAAAGSIDPHSHLGATAARQVLVMSNGAVDIRVDKEGVSPPAEKSPASSKGAQQAPSAAVGELSSNLQAAQSAVSDLREQLDSLNANVEQSQRQLQVSLEELRRKKKDEDSDRADVKAKMKVLEENKRQAEGAKREAEKKLREAESTRDAIRNRIDTMRQEASDMDKERAGCLDAVKESKDSREEHARETARKLASSAEELESMEAQVTEEGKANAELAEKVLRAVDVLQSLIDKSPQAMEEQHAGGYPSDGNVTTPKDHSDPTTPDFSRQHIHAGHDYNGYSGNMYGSIAQNHHDRLPPFQLAFPPSRMASREVSGQMAPGRFGQASGAFPFSRVPSFKDLSGYEGFGPMGGPPSMDRAFAPHEQHGRDTMQTLTRDDVEEPSSPTGTMSSSFTSNLHLLPQGLFRSLEGDATPVDDRDTGFSDYDIDEALGAPDDNIGSLLDQPQIPAIRRDSPEETITPPATSSGQEGDDEQHETPQLAEASTRDRHAHEPYGRTEALSSSPSRVSPRRWFSKAKAGGNAQVDALTDPVKHHSAVPTALLGRPLSLTLSNDSLLGSGQAFENAFAPSAAEKRALRWGSIGRWASNRQPGQGEYPGMAAGPSGSNGYVRTPPDSARSSSVDLTARSAWDHAVPGASSGAPANGEKNAFRFFSLGKKPVDK